LRDRNADMKHIRSQIGAFQQQSTCPSRALPTRFKHIQDTSRKLHEALCSARYCIESGHREHSAKLCLEADIQEEIRLDLGISCHETSRKGIEEAPIWLYVQSTTINASEYAAMAPKVNETPQMSPPMVLKKKASSDLNESKACRKKKKRVCFLDVTNEEALWSTPSRGLDLPHISSVISPQAAMVLQNLCQSSNICQYLRRTLHARNSFKPNQCVGYLETPQMYKQLFCYPKEALSVRTRPEAQKPAAFLSILDIMGNDPDDVLSVEDQLKLAHRTALAVLQFHDTPWLPKHWRLQRISYLGSRDVFDETTLKTLHLSSQLCAPIDPEPHSLAMEGVCAEATVSEEVQLGINNTTLFYLGVALLEIAHWTPLEDKMTPRDLNNPVFAARRLASGRTPLGPEYARIAQKCLQCNFGFGTELSSKGLQAAVYSEVVCQMEKMMESLQLSA
jgi:hypothetical protein